MKLTSFGFVAIAENFLKDALSAPPSTGGKWSLKRFTNFTDNSSSLQVLLTSDSGEQKTSALVQSRLTGSSVNLRSKVGSSMATRTPANLSLLKPLTSFAQKKKFLRLSTNSSSRFLKSRSPHFSPPPSPRRAPGLPLSSQKSQTPQPLPPLMNHLIPPNSSSK